MPHSTFNLSPSIIPLLEPSNVKSGDGPELDAMLRDLLPELERLVAKHAKAQARHAELAATANRQRGALKDGGTALNTLRYKTLTECVENPCPDYVLLASRLTAPEAEIALLADSVDLLTFVLLPDAEEHTLLTKLDLARTRHLEASLYAAREQAWTLSRTESAFPNQRAVTINQAVLALEAEARELERAASDVARNLEEFRTKREALQQARLLGARLSRAEAVYASVQMQQEKDNES